MFFPSVEVILFYHNVAMSGLNARTVAECATNRFVAMVAETPDFRSKNFLCKKSHEILAGQSSSSRDFRVIESWSGRLQVNARRRSRWQPMFSQRSTIFRSGTEALRWEGGFASWDHDCKRMIALYQSCACSATPRLRAD
jgi:hypothetical protein